MQYTSMKRIRAMTLFQQNALIYKKWFRGKIPET